MCNDLYIFINNSKLKTKTKYLLKLLPKILYINNFNKIFLLVTHPHIIFTEIDKDYIYKEFNKISSPLIDLTEKNYVEYINNNILNKLENNYFLIFNNEKIYPNNEYYNLIQNLINNNYEFYYFDYEIYNECIKFKNYIYINSDNDILDNYILSYNYSLKEHVKTNIDNFNNIIENIENNIDNNLYYIKNIINYEYCEFLKKNVQDKINIEINIILLDYIILNLTPNTTDFKILEKLNEAYKILYQKLLLEKKHDLIPKISWFKLKLNSYFNNYYDNNKIIIKKTEEDDIIYKHTYNNISLKNSKFNIKLKKRIHDNILKYNNKEEEIFSKINNDKLDNFIKLIEDTENIENNNLSISKEFYYSALTMSNWIDELSFNNSMGLLFKIKTNDYVKAGFDACPKITGYTNIFMPVKDYFSDIIKFFEKNKINDINDQSIFTGRVIGEANALLPLYINKYHWMYSKKHLPYILGFIMTNNPHGFIEKYYDYVFYILSDMIYYIYSFKHSKNIEEKTFSPQTENFIKIFISYLRTCSEISYERKYSAGIKKYVTKYYESNDMKIHKKYKIILGQIIASGCYIEKNNLIDITNYIFESCIYKNYEKYYKNGDFLNYLYNIISDEEFNDEMELFLNKYIDLITNDCKTLSAFESIYDILQEIYKEIGGFKKFINKLDNNYGIFDDNNIYKKICNNIKIINDYDYQSFKTDLDFIKIIFKFLDEEKRVQNTNFTTIEELYQTYRIAYKKT
jgi:hypothetical protein